MAESRKYFVSSWHLGYSSLKRHFLTHIQSLSILAVRCCGPTPTSSTKTDSRLFRGIVPILDSF